MSNLPSQITAQKKTPVVAVQHIRRMRGGAQGHQMRCSDGHFYVVKFRNNPQHLRVLANEMLATRLAARIGLPVPATEVVEVAEWLVEHSPDLCVQLAHSTIRCESGLHLGSRYVVSPLEGQVFDYLPVEMFGRVRNLDTFAGILVLDKWTGNADGRQAAFWRRLRERQYCVSFIDQGYCFNAGAWTFPDYPLRGVYSRNEVYEDVCGWASFEPWLSRIENMEEDIVWNIAADIPAEWYGENQRELETLVQTLLQRRGIIRDLIEAFRTSPRRPFPKWIEHQKVCVKVQQVPPVDAERTSLAPYRARRTHGGIPPAFTVDPVLGRRTLSSIRSAMHAGVNCSKVFFMSSELYSSNMLPGRLSIVIMAVVLVIIVCLLQKGAL